ncbi:MAG: 2-dehydropantoate 2-reductase, partial [Planctomycetota bacterium]|nr:2-dehydropantoate 2-reductase [Planctomycetota bacterium]
DVGVLVKPGHLEAIGRDGFILRTGDIARPAGPTLRAAADVGSLPGPPDLVVVAVKSCDTANALRGVSSKIPAGTVILCLQNGIGNEAKVQAALPENPVAAGAICISAEALRVGDILWPDDRGGMAVAPYCGDENRIRGVVAPLLATTGLECAWEEGEGAAARVKWSKLMLNVGFNALNSVTGLSSARLLADREYGKFAVLALREAFLVMRRSGIQALDLPGYPVRALGSIVRAPLGLVRKALAWQAARSTESAFSMRQDVLKGRASTEIDELNGVIVRRGREIGVDTPANERLCALIKKHAAAGWPSGGII